MCLCVCECVCFDVQRLYGSQRREGSLGDGLELVVIEWEQIEVVEVLKGVHAETRYLISIQQPGIKTRQNEGDADADVRWRLIL